MVRPPPLSSPNLSDKLIGGGGVPHLGYPVTHSGYPAAQGKADVTQEPRTGAGRVPSLEHA